MKFLPRMTVGPGREGPVDLRLTKGGPVMEKSRPIKLIAGAGMTVGPGEEGPVDLRLNERIYIYIRIRQLGQLACSHHGMMVIMIMKRLL